MKFLCAFVRRGHLKSEHLRNKQFCIEFMYSTAARFTNCQTEANL